ncbi:hypothetical protein V6N11_024599 [Hibiscus sabdariffa]|uniref:Uncharacterized protein n=1 Tax=Hibiscus sabdariffa TaxID=183260 RepID=A0ABR2QMM2_9ROSI
MIDGGGKGQSGSMMLNFGWLNGLVSRLGTAAVMVVRILGLWWGPMEDPWGYGDGGRSGGLVKVAALGVGYGCDG